MLILLFFLASEIGPESRSFGGRPIGRLRRPARAAIALTKDSLKILKGEDRGVRRFRLSPYIFEEWHKRYGTLRCAT